jgi:hypothetical protein
VVNEFGRLIALGLSLLARLIRRAWRGLRFLVRRAALTRAATASAVPGGGRLLDVAALSVAADLLMLAEWWRRSAPPAGLAAGIGLAVGVLAMGLTAWLLRGRTWTRLVLAGVEAGRLGCATLLAFAPPVLASTSSANLAVGGVIALGLAERALWTVSVTPGHRATTASAGARYVASLLVPIALAVLAGLAVGGLWALLLAQVALLGALIVALTLPPAGTRKAKPPKQRTRPAAKPSAEPPAGPAAEPAVEPAPTADSGESAYHLYRPNSLDGPSTPPPPPR